MRSREQLFEESVQEGKALLDNCRNGKVQGSGYNLWVIAGSVIDRGGSLESLGTTKDEVRNFLVEDLKDSWEKAKAAAEAGDIDGAYHYRFVVLLFAPVFEESEPPLETGVFEQLGISVAEIRKMGHDLMVSSAREELGRCRRGEVSDRFYGVKWDLLKGSTTLEEIGATQEEIDKFAATYSSRHIDSNWDHVSWSYVIPRRVRATS